MAKQFIILLCMCVEIVFMARFAEQTVSIMIFSIGVGMNGLAVLGNGGRMPVRGLIIQTPHHAPETAGTRYRWFIDSILVDWIGPEIPECRFSLGDVLIEVGLAIYVLGTVARILVKLVA